MTQIKARKTNKNWYPYEEDGCYYRLEDGTLMQCPMNIDGTRDDNPCEVDMQWTEDKDRPMLLEIIKELEGKE